MQNEAVSVLGDTDAEMSACVSMFVYFFFSDTYCQTITLLMLCDSMKGKKPIKRPEGSAVFS